MKQFVYNLKLLLVLIFFFSGTSSLHSQHVNEALKKILKQTEDLRTKNQPLEALRILDEEIKNTKANDELAYLYAYQSRNFLLMDSLLSGKLTSDLSIKHSEKTDNAAAKAIALMSRAYLNNYLSIPDEIIKNAMEGLKYLANSEEDPSAKAMLNYLLYSAYSNWNDTEKMENYIKACIQYAKIAEDNNILANGYNGLPSTYLVKFERTKDKKFADSSLVILQNAYNLYISNPEKVSTTTFAFICMNIANHLQEYSTKDYAERKQEAFQYLEIAERELIKRGNENDRIANIYGIKSEFARKENNFGLAEKYLLTGLEFIKKGTKDNYETEYKIKKALAEFAAQKGNFQSALTYQIEAEEILMKLYNEQQIFNAQKLEIQYETEKKNQQLILLQETADLRKKQNYLWIGIAIASVLGLAFLFRSYHFKLRYSIEREKKIVHEKEEAEHNAQMQMKLEKEEQARLKAEQRLLEMQQQQLQKEVMANALQIEHKNEVLQKIKQKINDGDAKKIEKMLKEEMMLDTDFEDAKNHIQKTHPNFFKKVNETARQKLTSLDLKYCAYIHLNMNTKQIAQLLNVEAQSVRMFKYRLKQKFELGKETDLDGFLQNME